MGNFLCLIFGAIIMVILFGLMDFTPQIESVDVERAVSVCKDGKWDKINNTEIHCADGAVYPRRIEN